MSDRIVNWRLLWQEFRKPRFSWAAALTFVMVVQPVGNLILRSVK